MDRTRKPDRVPAVRDRQVFRPYQIGHPDIGGACMLHLLTRRCGRWMAGTHYDVLPTTQQMFTLHWLGNVVHLRRDRHQYLPDCTCYHPTKGVHVQTFQRYRQSELTTNPIS